MFLDVVLIVHASVCPGIERLKYFLFNQQKRSIKFAYAMN